MNKGGALRATWVILLAWSLASLSVGAFGQKTIHFSGYDWIVRSGQGGPGPNIWDQNDAWIDGKGRLHLKIARRGDQWSCAEVYMKDRLGFGRYQFQVIGRIDRLDDNVVLGLFNYPTPDVGPDGTNEIDIEFARWGNHSYPNGNYTVWPSKQGLNNGSHTFEFQLAKGSATTHRFTWGPSSILFQSLYGHRDDNTNEFARWLYQPQMPASYISQQAQPVHINLWLFKGQPPKDQKEVELVVSSFTFTPQ